MAGIDWFSGYSVPYYGFGSDYRHYGSGNHVDGLKKYSDKEYRVLFTKDFVKQTGDTSKKLGRYIQTDHEWKEYQIMVMNEMKLDMSMLDHRKLLKKHEKKNRLRRPMSEYSGLPKRIFGS